MLQTIEQALVAVVPQARGGSLSSHTSLWSILTCAQKPCERMPAWLPMAGTTHGGRHDMAKLPDIIRARTRRNEEIVDAEWEEVDDRLEEGWSLRLFAEWLQSEWRTSKIFRALVAIAALLALLPLTEPGEDQAFNRSIGPSGKRFEGGNTLTNLRIVGTYVYATMGGEDGQTRCEDFNNPHLYQRNGNLAELVEFGPDGSYRQLFAYTTPSGQEHYQSSFATWSLTGNTLSFGNVYVDAPFGGAVDDYSSQIDDTHRNVLVIDSEDNGRRLVRCRGDVAGSFGDDPRQLAGGPADQREYIGQPDFAGLCTNQDVIDEVSQAFRTAIMRTLMSDRMSRAQISDDQVVFAAAAIRREMDRSNIHYRNLRAGQIDDERPRRVTVTCLTDVRVVTPTEGAHGAFSDYVQFNGSSFRIRFEDPESEGGVPVYYAQIGDPNQPLDVEVGTE
ncbi:hypothetical protein GCM10011411_26790 [Aurantiacibacter arachoides]|nr:hypothetical protein GCM10011411_26790 [Aurantiacibacter arachoides]